MSKVNFIPGRWGQGYIMHQQRILLLGPQPLLLDDYPGAAAAYSLRKLRTDYTGAAIRVRESATNTEADIGFTSSGELDTTALLAHTGANDGFVTTWYDQAGSNNATQSTAANQPQIVSGGSVILENGKTSIQFIRASNTRLTVSSSQSLFTFLHEVKSSAIYAGSINQVSTSLCVLFDTTLTAASSARGATMGIRSNKLEQIISRVVAGSYAAYQNEGVFIDGSQNIYYTDFDATNITLNQRLKAHLNGGSAIATNTSNGAGTDGNSNGNFTIGTLANGTSGWNGKAQELIIYPSDQSANRIAIESNINAYYNIYP